jgi:hypothetical protein
LSGDSSLVREFGVLNTDFSRRLDPALRIPESYQLNAGVERDLGRGYSVEANFSSHAAYICGANSMQMHPCCPRVTTTSPNISLRAISRTSRIPQPPRVCFTTPQPRANWSGLFMETRRQYSRSRDRVWRAGFVMNLNSPSSTTMLDVALAAINNLRPDPSRGELEQLISAGNSFYRGMTLELRKRFEFRIHFSRRLYAFEFD